MSHYYLIIDTDDRGIKKHIVRGFDSIADLKHETLLAVHGEVADYKKSKPNQECTLWEQQQKLLEELQDQGFADFEGDPSIRWGFDHESDVKDNFLKKHKAI